MQQALLKILEGTVASVPRAASMPHQEHVQVDTTNILFICGGSFEGLERIIEQRIGRRSVGFAREQPDAAVADDEIEQRRNLIRQVRTEDLERFGLIPEFIGRLPVIAVQSLDREALVQILVEPENVLVGIPQNFLSSRTSSSSSRRTRSVIADQALKRGTGARGLRAILEEVLLNTMYDLPGRSDIGKCVIDGDTVLEKVNPMSVPRSAGRVTRPKRVWIVILRLATGGCSARSVSPASGRPSLAIDRRSRIDRRAGLRRASAPAPPPRCDLPGHGANGRRGPLGPGRAQQLRPHGADHPSTARIELLMSVMGEPQRAAPAIHITGTNGKGSTAQVITRPRPRVMLWHLHQPAPGEGQRAVEPGQRADHR